MRVAALSLPTHTLLGLVDVSSGPIGREGQGLVYVAPPPMNSPAGSPSPQCYGSKPTKILRAPPPCGHDPMEVASFPLQTAKIRLQTAKTRSGKSVLANFVSESTEGISSYVPTQGVRILEYEKPNVNGNSKGAGCRFELWDCGGDQKFETCWPALMKDSHGVVIVFNPDLPSHLKEIEMWYSCFVQQQQLLDSQCLLIAHHKPGSAGDTENLSLASPLNKLKLIHSSLEEDPEDVRMEFVKYFKSIINLLNESRDREEMSIIT